MEIAASQLAARLAGIEARCFLVHGAETLLVEEARDAIRAHFAAAGFGDVNRYTAEAGFDWSALTQSARSLSLFAEDRYIELRLGSGQPGDRGTAFVADFLDQGDPSTVLVILGGKLDKRALSGGWYRDVARRGVVVDTGSVTQAALPEWIRRRFAGVGVPCTAEVAARLAWYVEGNLLAADQEVRKLALLVPSGTSLDAARLEAVMADHARFTVFALVDACVAGQAERVVRVLRSLRQGGAEPVMMVWVLARETRSLSLVGAALKAGEPRSDVFRRYRVWSSRAPLVVSALKRLGLSRLAAIHSSLAYLDRLVKGHEPDPRGPADVWVEIERVALALCGIKTVN